MRPPAPRSCGDVHADACARRSCRVRGSPHPKRPTAHHGPAPLPSTPVESGNLCTVPWHVPDRRGFPRTTSRGFRHDMARPAASSFGMSGPTRPITCFLVVDLLRFFRICDQVFGWCPKNFGHGSGDFGSVAIWRFEGFLDVAPIHGRDNRGGGTRLARRNRGGGGMRRGSKGSRDMEGLRHVGHAYAGDRIQNAHDCSNPPLVLVDDLEAKRSRQIAQPNF